MRGYSTKYALTSGVEEVEIDLEYGSGSRPNMSDFPGYEQVPKYVYSRAMRQQLIAGKTFFLTRQEAAAATIKDAKAKVKAARKQIAKLEQLIESEDTKGV